MKTVSNHHVSPYLQRAKIGIGLMRRLDNHIIAELDNLPELDANAHRHLARMRKVAGQMPLKHNVMCQRAGLLIGWDDNSSACLGGTR